MNREKVASTMRQWIADGKMFSAAMLNRGGLSPHDQNRKCASGELFRSRHGAILFTEDALRKQFELWMYGDKKCVYTLADLDSLKGLTKLYDVNKACANGRFLRFDDLGKSATLYIE